MIRKELKTYCDRALAGGATGVRVIDPASVVTAPWVRWKCQFGCDGYDFSYCCPPHTPTDQETRRVLDAYRRAILFHIQTVPAPDRSRRLERFRTMLIDLEGELFKEGYYRAFVFLAGPCRVCRECGKLKGQPCSDRYRARPSMEACGIDVFQTARNNRFPIQPLRDESEPRNTFALMLVD